MPISLPLTTDAKRSLGCDRAGVAAGYAVQVKRGAAGNPIKAGLRVEGQRVSCVRSRSSSHEFAHVWPLEFNSKSVVSSVIIRKGALYVQTRLTC